MSTVALIPGVGFVQETQASEQLIPANGFVNETYTSPATFLSAWALGSNQVIVGANQI